MGSAAAVAHRVEIAFRHDIPSLDGLRALSVAIVVLSHTSSLLPAAVARSGLFRYLIGGGLHGVQVFFVTSGYLITTLLLREFDRSRNISLGHFYTRRTLRIFPPFYLYLAVVALLWATGARQDRSTFLAAATYAIVYLPHPRGWLLQHAWSLSIEEQFYLLWPTVLRHAVRRGAALQTVLAALAIIPIIRIILLILSNPRSADHNRLLVNSSAVDMLTVGCLLALLSPDVRWRKWCRRWITPWSVLGAGSLGLVLVPYANVKLSATFLAVPAGALGYTATALAIGAVLEYLVRAPQSIVGRMLNAGPVRHIGAISYSIYLWQQLFTENPARLGFLTYPLILIAAEGSFWLIERPLMRVRARYDSGGRYRADTAELTSSATSASVAAASPNASIQ